VLVSDNYACKTKQVMAPYCCMIAKGNQYRIYPVYYTCVVFMIWLKRKCTFCVLCFPVDNPESGD